MKTTRVVAIAVGLALIGAAAAAEQVELKIARFDGWIVDELCADQHFKATDTAWIAECDPEMVPWVVWVDKEHAYEITNPEKVADFFGKKVRVVGTLDADGRLKAGSAVELK